MSDETGSDIEFVQIQSAAEMSEAFERGIMEAAQDQDLAIASTISQGATAEALIGIKYELELLNKNLRSFMHQWLRYGTKG